MEHYGAIRQLSIGPLNVRLLTCLAPAGAEVLCRSRQAMREKVRLHFPCNKTLDHGGATFNTGQRTHPYTRVISVSIKTSTYL